MVYHQQGKLEEAIAQYQQAIATNPNDDKTYNNSGVTYSDPGRLVFGMPQDNSTTNPNYAQAHYHLGFVYNDQGKLTDAIAEYQQAIQIDLNFASLYMIIL